MRDFNHISFFSGKGGFDLAAQLMGWNNVAHCEINPFLQTLLKYYWPNAITYGNIKDTDFSIHRGNIDIVTGGFPCQPYSISGKRLGKDDERHLWPEMLRGIGEIQPTWVVGENVRGLINWDGGMVFDEVQADLEATGYEVFPFLLPASGVGAPHERYRIWFVAYSDLFRRKRDQARKEGLDSGQRGEAFDIVNGVGGKRDVAHTNSTRGERRTGRKQTERKQKSIEKQPWGCSQFYTADFESFPSQPPICFGDDGISFRLDTNAVFSGKNKKGKDAHTEWSKQSLQASGNAVVPQLVLQFFKAIELYMKTVV